MEAQNVSTFNTVKPAEKKPEVEQEPKNVDVLPKNKEEKTNENAKKYEEASEYNDKDLIEIGCLGEEKVHKEKEANVKVEKEKDGNQKDRKKKKNFGRVNMKLPSSNNMVDIVCVPGIAQPTAKAPKPSTENKSRATPNKEAQPKVNAKPPKGTMKAAKETATGNAGNKKKKLPKEKKAVRTEIYDVPRSSTGSDIEDLGNVGWIAWLWARVCAFLGF